MDSILLHEIYTVIGFLAFIGVCVWSYLPRNKQYFEKLGETPFLDLAKDTEHD